MNSSPKKYGFAGVGAEVGGAVVGLCVGDAVVGDEVGPGVGLVDGDVVIVVLNAYAGSSNCRGDSSSS